MKKSGMEKLIELKLDKLIKPLEKYLLELAKKNPLYTNFNVNLPGVSILGVHETILVSEKFGFIKRLVENDKINHHKISEIIIYSQWRYTGVNKTTAQRVDENYLDLLLMILSISDNPVELLIDILA